jgi:hypothetical protein
VGNEYTEYSRTEYEDKYLSWEGHRSELQNVVCTPWGYFVTLSVDSYVAAYDRLNFSLNPMSFGRFTLV